MQKNQVDAVLMPGSGRSPGGGHGNPLQYSYLGNPMNRGSWKATVCRVTKSHMLLSTHTPKIFQNNATKMPFCKGYGFLPVIFVWLFFPLEVSDIQESVAEFIQNCIPMQLCHRSKTQKIYCNPEGFLCSFSIYICLRNSISLSSITIVSSCLWLYFI